MPETRELAGLPIEYKRYLGTYALLASQLNVSKFLQLNENIGHFITL